MAANTQYFLGIEGEQLGPLSEAELLDRIRSGSLSPDSLIWWEGESDWVSIIQIDKFKVEFDITSQTNISAQNSLGAVFTPPSTPASTPQPKNTPSPLPQPSSPATPTPTTYNPQRFISFAEKGSELAPVFAPEESKVASELILPKKVLIMGGVFIALCFGTWAFLQFKPRADDSAELKVKTKVPKNTNLAQRKKQLTEAEMELLLNPSKSLQTMTQLFTSNPKDEVGQEAAKALLNYYSKNKLYDLAGNVLLKLDKPGEAAQMFLQDPKLAAQAEKALFQAYQTGTGKEKADFLIQDIDILIRPLKNMGLAKERISLFEKTFPALKHPFNYYSLPIDQRIQSIFDRISFKLVEQVTLHMKEEFPQITLVSKPTVEVKRNTAGDLRIIARYRGDLLLSADRLDNVFFVLWWIDGQWILVDTNLTQERQKYASSMRKKYEAVVLPPAKMLEVLEGQFNQLFPDQSFHESPSVKSPPQKMADE